jgi:hypothetical protein
MKYSWFDSNKSRRRRNHNSSIVRVVREVRGKKAGIGASG